MIEDEWRQDLHGYIGGTIHSLGALPIAVGGVADHVHALIQTKATHSIADLMREVKKSSSVLGRERYHAFEWQAGYGAFSASLENVDRVAAYVRN